MSTMSNSKNTNVNMNPNTSLYRNLLLIFSIFATLYHFYSLYLSMVIPQSPYIEGYFLYNKNVINIISHIFVLCITYLYLLNFKYVRDNTASTLPFIIDFVTSVFFIISGSLDKTLIFQMLITGFGLIFTLRYRKLNGIASEIV